VKTLGVLGGMGPAATFEFCARLTAAIPAARDQDHPHILVDCDPRVPDRNAAQRDAGPSPGPYLGNMARTLAAAGADVLAMPCNTAHRYRAEIEAAAPGALVDMIEATADAAAIIRPRTVGVLAVDGCLAAGLYQEALAARGAACLLLDVADQRAFMDLVYRIKGNRIGADERGAMQALAGRLVGAEAVIAGCTEIGLVLSAGDFAVPLVDSTDALVAATVRRLMSE